MILGTFNFINYCYMWLLRYRLYIQTIFLTKYSIALTDINDSLFSTYHIVITLRI